MVGIRRRSPNKLRMELLKVFFDLDKDASYEFKYIIDGTMLMI
jgi:hypothetical protein